MFSLPLSSSLQVSKSRENNLLAIFKVIVSFFQFNFVISPNPNPFSYLRRTLNPWANLCASRRQANTYFFAFCSSFELGVKTNLLMTASWETRVLFSRSIRCRGSSRGNKTHYFPRSQSLSTYSTSEYFHRYFDQEKMKGEET